MIAARGSTGEGRLPSAGDRLLVPAPGTRMPIGCSRQTWTRHYALTTLFMDPMPFGTCLTAEGSVYQTPSTTNLY